MDTMGSRTPRPLLLAVLALLLLGAGCRAKERGPEPPATRAAESAAAAALRGLSLPDRGPAPAPASRRDPGLAIQERCVHPPLAAEGAFVVRSGLTFLEVGGEALALDLMTPVGDGPFPLVVLIHGGGWVSGKRQELVHEQRMLVGQGIAAATVDYRLANAPDSKFPAAVQDVRCAVRFLRSRAREYRLAPDRVLAMGPSSGGHLAAMLAAAGDDPRLDEAGCLHRDLAATVSGAVAFYAPLELRPFMGAGVPERILTTFLGESPLDRPGRAALASPITHLDVGDPPFLLVHGAADVLVPPRQSRVFKGLLDRLGVPSLYVEVPKVGHGFFMFKGAPEFRRATCTTVAFIRKVLAMPPAPPPPDGAATRPALPAPP